MDQKSGKPSQKRRAILQGSLAAPVVLTVSSPRARAAHQLGEVPREHQEQPAAESLCFKDAPDNWLRHPVNVVTDEVQGRQDSLLSKEEWFYLDPARTSTSG